MALNFNRILKRRIKKLKKIILLSKLIIYILKVYSLYLKKEYISIIVVLYKKK